MSDTDEPHSARAQYRLWRRIASRPDQAVLARMRTHGFWPLDAPPPSPDIEAPPPPDPRGARKQRAERNALLRAERVQQRAQRLEAWRQRRGSDAVHLGVGVSDGLHQQRSDVERLELAHLPLVHDAADLASALGLDLRTLRWLTFHRRGAALVHYHRYDVPKKTGGARGISAPKKTLKAAQHWVLHNILERVDVDPHAHGFVRERSIVTNARPHARRTVVINLDLREFFPSIHFRRVRGLFSSLGYSGQVATVLALLCTEPPRVPVRVDGDPTGRVLHVALSERQLPQGAPTSPALTNVLCRRLDRRLVGAAAALGFVYTRYADDLTFSADQGDHVKVLMARVRRILVEEGFAENEDKTRVMRQGRRQEVTGLVVNHRPGVDRRELRRLRAVLHNAARLGLESQNRERHPAFAAHLAGKIAFVSMVDPRRGAQLASMLALVLQGRT